VQQNSGDARWIIAALAGPLLACVGLPADRASAQQASPPQWQFYLSPYVWIAGVSGTIKTPNPRVPDQSIDAGFGDVLSHLNGIPIMGAAEARYGRFGVMADIIAISVKSDVKTNDVVFAGGTVQLSQVIGSALSTYRIVDQSRQSLDIGVGVRAFGVSTKFTLNPGLLPGFSVSPGISWADPILGARYHYDVSPRWGLTAYGDVGGGPDSEFTWQLLGTADFRISKSTVLRFGFRHLQFQYEGSRLRQNMGMNGPIIGCTTRF
jgi:hypothetical protein